MANRKISDLTALTATATGDLLPIVDISEAGAADQNKKITIENLFKGIPGNVGIGTSSPGTPFEVAAASSAGASTVARFRHDNGADQHYLDVSVNPDTDTVKLISPNISPFATTAGDAIVPRPF